MALGLETTTGVICTSGTAVLNLYPGITEAFYQRIPLLVLTADRPEERIDQWDGQTIHQNKVFDSHVLQSLELPQDLDVRFKKKEIEKSIFSAASLTLFPVKGPVHINVPLREPIYTDLNEPFFAEAPEHIFSQEAQLQNEIDLNFLHAELASFKKILIVCGQMPPHTYLKATFKTLSLQIPVLGDITSNLFGSSLQDWDKMLQQETKNAALKPDLLITTGLSTVSKSLKTFLKENKPKHHWHIQSAGFTGDPFETQPQTLEIDPVNFFEAMSDITGIDNIDYLNQWKLFAENHKNANPFSNPTIRDEFEFISNVMHQTPAETSIHFGNSMAIRYASFCGFTKSNVFCNRGTSGIDGTLSTAVGYALARPNEKVFCMLGDLSFFYDSNALWSQKLPQNLGIIVLNNQGGKIFSYISGPNLQPGLEPFIQTPHNRTAKHIAHDYSIPFFEYHFQTDQVAKKVLSLNTPFIAELTHESA